MHFLSISVSFYVSATNLETAILIFILQRMRKYVYQLLWPFFLYITYLSPYNMYKKG